MKSRLPGAVAPAPVRVWTEDVLIPTYLPDAPDRNPMFLEKRVYQGSSGKVYPLPFIDRIAEKPVDRRWKAIWIENEFLQVMILPEIGGRIHRMIDRTNGYDLIYYQPVIKPALVGLAGPWISGGIEFNWPQHHRPATFMPVDFVITPEPDGGQTVWCGDHDPLARLKGMHGVCLHPRQACFELKVRAYNRTPTVQTFLWWANVATRVHEAYQSFFPPDVYYVADHARRSMTGYPLAGGQYYGVDYGERGRRGVPPDEIPTQFVPPHCREATPQANCESRTANQLPSYPANDLAFYANIPVPTSYMCMGSEEDFFGGYDYAAQAGLIHVANHHLSPGKKQWTWGNHEFGYAWDRNLTDPDAHGEYGPYIEIMAGVYTDNQPDFSFLQPGETKTWSQHWYPIQKIGPAHHANREAAVHLELGPRRFRLGVAATSRFPGARIRLERANGAAEWETDLAPDQPFVLDSPQASRPWRVGATTLRVLARDGRELISYQPKPRVQGKVPSPATEPSPPSAVASADELFLIGLHLEQYRHATRCPTAYWREALRRDPGDARCHHALGRWHLNRGEFALAETHFLQAIDRLTQRNANPADGESYYYLGLCLRHQLDALPGTDSTLAKPLFKRAYAAFYKATWNQAWIAPGSLALAELDCRRADWPAAFEHLQRSLRFNTDHLQARNLQSIVLRHLGRADEAEALLQGTRLLDPLDAWSAHTPGQPLSCDAQTALDLAWDLARAGLDADAVELLEPFASRVANDATGSPDPRNLGTAPLVHYCLGWLHLRLARPSLAMAFGQPDSNSGRGRLVAATPEPARRRLQAGQARAHFRLAAAAPVDYCFPARLEEIAILETAMRVNPRDARAPYYLGNLLYDRRRHAEALRFWDQSARLDPTFSIVWRNLGIGCFNLHRQPARARSHYEKAFRAAPNDARLLYERDQLWKRLGESPSKRRREIEKRLDLVRQRDDLSVELAALYNQTGEPSKALELLGGRHFQPWEGGEGGPLGQHVRSHLALGRRALKQGHAEKARDHFEAAMNAPRNLGEARHLLANQSDLHYWLGRALDALGQKRTARQHWKAAATFKGDFQEMSVRAFSEMTFFSAQSWGCLGQPAQRLALLRDLLAHARKLRRTPARIDYFATSLPTMLLFDDDLQFRQETTALFLQAQAHLGLGRVTKARMLLRQVLDRDPNHALAADLLQEQADR
ncbi:MAG: DUF5107 domain-containing protein [Limisphaerales bacterium]